jgi:hypothetical protein
VVSDLGPHLAVDVLSGRPAAVGPDPVPATSGDTLTGTRPAAVADAPAVPRRDATSGPRPAPKPALGARPARTADRTSGRDPQWTSKQLRAFKLRDEEGMTYAQIARRLGMSEKQIGRWFKARDEGAAKAAEAPAVGPVVPSDVLSVLPAPTPPVMSGINGHSVATPTSPEEGQPAP